MIGNGTGKMIQRLFAYWFTAIETFTQPTRIEGVEFATQAIRDCTFGRLDEPWRLSARLIFARLDGRVQHVLGFRICVQNPRCPFLLISELEITSFFLRPH